jgi:hypothetical protein
MGVWQAVRRRVYGRNPDAVMLAEIIPPWPGFHDQAFDMAYDSDLFHAFGEQFAGAGGLDGFGNTLVTSHRGPG